MRICYCKFLLLQQVVGWLAAVAFHVWLSLALGGGIAWLWMLLLPVTGYFIAPMVLTFTVLSHPFWYRMGLAGSLISPPEMCAHYGHPTELGRM